MHGTHDKTIKIKRYNFEDYSWKIGEIFISRSNLYYGRVERIRILHITKKYLHLVWHDKRESVIWKIEKDGWRTGNYLMPVHHYHKELFKFHCQNNTDRLK